MSTIPHCQSLNKHYDDIHGQCGCTKPSKYAKTPFALQLSGLSHISDTIRAKHDGWSKRITVKIPYMFTLL